MVSLPVRGKLSKQIKIYPEKQAKPSVFAGSSLAIKIPFPSHVRPVSCKKEKEKENFTKYCFHGHSNLVPISVFNGSLWTLSKALFFLSLHRGAITKSVKSNSSISLAGLTMGFHTTPQGFSPLSGESSCPTLLVLGPSSCTAGE